MYCLVFEATPKVGILGEVISHYFMIEAQGKGTLHAHGLVWLTDGKQISFVEKGMTD